jgi:hypothetical protein
MVSQQNLRKRTIAIVVLGNSEWRIVQRYVRRIAAAVNAATSGSYAEVDIPLVRLPRDIFPDRLPTNGLTGHFDLFFAAASWPVFP